ncbi:putative membrane protein [Teredinibacter turnerae T7901]|uniref:Membrane protein n=1 Tax=Teredinibacter turnerae (strain ATCC 39867 / T7901) TaxID=377629 RepID=C5BL39_TERTT|nr:VC0807 family protein [Teredinibacter turnerae]ACR14548.1 putative membrane protein [Teredinibacter turnerae T7901]
MAKTDKKENPFVNLLINVIIPTVILVKFSGADYLGPKLGLIVALAFPIVYGIYDFVRTRKVNFFSAFGVLSVILTGGMSLLQLDPKYIAIKEAAIPLLFGAATLISLKTPYPLVKTFLFNDAILQTDKVHHALEERGNRAAFERTLVYASYMIAGSFLLSSVLNYVLAKIVLVSTPGTEEFNAELGTMTALSLPVITIPSMLVLFGALFYLFRQIKALAGLSLEDVFVDPSEKTDNNAEPSA